MKGGGGGISTSYNNNVLYFQVNFNKNKKLFNVNEIPQYQYNNNKINHYEIVSIDGSIDGFFTSIYILLRNKIKQIKQKNKFIESIDDNQLSDKINQDIDILNLQIEHLLKIYNHLVYKNNASDNVFTDNDEFDEVHNVHAKKIDPILFREQIQSQDPLIVAQPFYEGGKSRKTKTIKNKTKKRFLYNPNNPKTSFDVYIDKDPSDTIPIKYTTIEDVKNTILKLENLYKSNKYTHKRIWQVGMIMKVRLESMLKHKKSLYSKAKNVRSRFLLANKYFLFLGKRSKVKNDIERKNMVFQFV